MSFEPVVWAMKSAPVADAEEFAVLSVMALSADEDGCNAFQATATIAQRTKLATRTVQRRIDSLLERGLIARGDQGYWKLLQIPEHQRPVNYDLMIPCSWWGPVRWDEANQWREQNGRRPWRPGDRPDVQPAPESSPRTARRTPAAVQGASHSQGVTPSHPVSDGQGVTRSRAGGDSQSVQGVSASHPTFPTNLPQDRTPLFVVADAPTQQIDPGDVDRKSIGRADVEALCNRMADLVAATSDPPRRPRITKRWRRDARLLLDDGVPLDRAIRLLEWTAKDPFWSANVLSVPKFREKYEELRRKALADWQRQNAQNAPRPRSPAEAALIHGTSAIDPAKAEDMRRNPHKHR